MRIEQLEYTAAVARHGSFRRAADELHISQPALSAAVRKLERELGIDIFERGRAGARVSDVGADLLPHIVSAIDAVHGLRQAAGQQHRASRMVRIGTVNAGTVGLLTPTIGAFRAEHPDTQVEVVGAQEAQIDQGLREGSFDLGLVTCLEGDDTPPDLETSRLITGRAIACLHVDSPLAAQASVTVEDLLAGPLVLMRAGYLMHRLVHRLLDGRDPTISYSTDGAEMGKLMVAEGLGATVLPDFSVVDDPLVKAGVITWRPLRDAGADVWLAIRRRRSDAHPQAARELRTMFLERGAAYGPPTRFAEPDSGHAVSR